MATEKIDPALPAKEWQRLRMHSMHHAYVESLRDRGFDVLVGATHWAALDLDAADEQIDAASQEDDSIRRRATIAVLNDMLRDDDPRKITREKIDDLRGALRLLLKDDASSDESDGFAFLDALESYLPPEAS